MNLWAISRNIALSKNCCVHFLFHHLVTLFSHFLFRHLVTLFSHFYFLCQVVKVSDRKFSNEEALALVNFLGRRHTIFNMFKGAFPALFLFIFWSFQTTKQSRIWFWDTNSRPLEHESPPITTRIFN